MTKNNSKNTYQFDVIDWKNGIVKIPNHILNELDKDKSISITISESAYNVLEKFHIDPTLFSKIKDIQELPEEAVINFILAESSLVSTDF